MVVVVTSEAVSDRSLGRMLLFSLMVDASASACRLRLPPGVPEAWSHSRATPWRGSIFTAMQDNASHTRQDLGFRRHEKTEFPAGVNFPYWHLGRVDGPQLCTCIHWVVFGGYTNFLRPRRATVRLDVEAVCRSLRNTSKAMFIVPVQLIWDLISHESCSIKAGILDA